MRRIENLEDGPNGIVTYEISDGRRIAIDRLVCEEIGPAEAIRLAGFASLLPTERLPVFWHGKMVGSMAPDFDPTFIKSKNYFYDPRPGDFTRDGSKWIASRILGPGDLESVSGFRWEHD